MARSVVRGSLYAGALLFGALWGGCQCTPTLPTIPDDPDPPPMPTADTTPTGDTGPEPACANPEVEPNDSEAEALVLPLEQLGCGVISEPLDIDYYVFDLDDDGWILVDLQGADGSIADMSLLLSGPDWLVVKNDDIESKDPHLVFQAPAGTYTALVSEQTFSGGDRYDYRLLISEAKPPVEWISEEQEPNDASDDALVLTHGDQIYGTMDNGLPLEDFDWYRMAVPGGKHELTIDIDAFDYGSGADLTAILYDEDLGVIREIEGGPVAGSQPDPEYVYDSAGDETVFIQIVDRNHAEGPAGWYVLNVLLEGE